MKLSRILFAFGSRIENSSALRRSLALAKTTGADLTVCAVIDRLPAERLRMLTAVTPGEIAEALAAERRGTIDNLIGSLNVGDVSIQTKVLVGNPDTEICQLVRVDGYDLLVKPIAKRRGAGARSASRTDRRLMRSCPCPVWFCHETDEAVRSSILVALDLQDESPGNARLNERIVEVAGAIALAEDRPLHLVNAWHLPGEGRMYSTGTDATAAILQRVIAHETAKRMSWLQSTMGASARQYRELEFGRGSPTFHVVNGYSLEVIPEMAEQLDAGLIVMGTAARKGLFGLLVGNTAERILPQVARSVLVVGQPLMETEVEPSSPAQEAPGYA